MPTLNKATCPTCGQSVNEREIGLFSGMAEALFRVWKWCKEKNRHEFERKEVSHLFRGESEIARFGDWVFFGGLVYRPTGKKGIYGINVERCDKFFAGQLQIPTVVYKNPLTKELRYDHYGTLGQLKNLRDFLDENYEFIVKYRNDYEESQRQTRIE